MSTDVRRFEETQTFPLWGYAVLAAGTLAGSAGIGAATRGAGAAAAVQGLAILGPMALIANLLSMKTVVAEGALTVTFGWAFPMYRRTIRLSQILSAEVVTYNPLLEYGGWGIRGWGGNVAFNARGNRSVRLGLEGGKRVLVGSQRPEALAQALLSR